MSLKICSWIKQYMFLSRKIRNLWHGAKYVLSQKIMFLSQKHIFSWVEKYAPERVNMSFLWGKMPLNGEICPRVRKYILRKEKKELVQIFGFQLLSLLTKLQNMFCFHYFAKSFSNLFCKQASCSTHFFFLLCFFHNSFVIMI